VNLLLVRHGIARDRAEFAARAAPRGRDDRERPLTEEGRRKMRLAARGLRTLIPQISWLGTSPLVRSRQTAEILAKAYGTELTEVAELAPEGDAARLWAALRRVRGGGLRCVVGHEPDLSSCIAFLLRGVAPGAPPAPITELKKGGACLLEVERPGLARILWLAEPRVLRRLAR
jgi:phosphohistidine phosphatase